MRRGVMAAPGILVPLVSVRIWTSQLNLIYMNFNHFSKSEIIAHMNFYRRIKKQNSEFELLFEKFLKDCQVAYERKA